MTKVSRSYESVVRGVSEQVPQDRRSGQHYAQMNMISDPVVGLARRHGSRLKDELVMGNATPTLVAGLAANSDISKPVGFSVDGNDYDLICRRDADRAALGQTGFAFCFNRTTGQFIPISYAAGDAALDSLVSGGVSSAVGVGRFLFLAGRTITPEWVGTQRHEAPANVARIAGWVRGGAYSRSFKITLKRANGTEVEASYKTVSASYPTLLNTSDLLTSDTDYQKKVNDRVYAHNSEVTKWIGTAAADITPENIAEQLRLDLISKGVVGVTRVEGTVMIEDPNFIEASGEDGGDGSLMRVVGNELLSADLLSTVHWVGKVVKIRPLRSNGDDAFYLEAFAKDNISTGITEVSWREAAGFQMQPTVTFVIATVVGGTLYMGSNPAALATATGIDVPPFKANSVGDDITSPLPTMFGNRIDYLGSFQDRLVIGSGTVILMSKPGDYFNWFRTSVLTIADDDPIELFSLGSEDDTIRASTTYDRNLLLFGKKKQYTINGRQPITPKTASVVVITAHEDAVDAEPVNSGNYVFYAQASGPDDRRVSSFQQIQVGQLADTPESADLGQQLSTYLSGNPVQIVAVTKPKFAVLRTTGERHGFATYGYLDNPGNGERVVDSWSKWGWDASLGVCVGVSKSLDGSGLYVFMLRNGLDSAGAAKWWIACEQFDLTAKLSLYPYADSLRTYPTMTDAGSFLNANNMPDAGCIAFGQGSLRPFVGSPLDLLPQFLADREDEAEAFVGITAPAFVTPTNPYMLDRNGKAITSGRLTLGRVAITVAETAGMTVDVTSFGTTKRVTDFNGRILGSSLNVVGYQPVYSGTVKSPIGKEARKCTYTIGAKSWLPLTVTSLEWVGQYFNNTRRL